MSTVHPSSLKLMNLNFFISNTTMGNGVLVTGLVPDRTARTLTELILEHIHPGTRIVSDGWASYAGI